MYRSVAAELADPQSPVTQFMKTRFPETSQVTRRYHANCPLIIIPPANDVNPGVLASAADWLMRFTVHPAPSLIRAWPGATKPDSLALFADIDRLLGYGQCATGSPPDGMPPWLISRLDDETFIWLDAEPAYDNPFTGPTGSSAIDAGTLSRVCWCLALLTAVGVSGNLARRPLRGITSVEAMPVSQEALDQLSAFRDVFRTHLLPGLPPGRWLLGPSFGSYPLPGDGDLIAGNTLLGLTTVKATRLTRHRLYELITYALLDEEHGLTKVAVFSARYGYLVTWELEDLLHELSGQQTGLTDARTQFRACLKSSY